MEGAHPVRDVSRWSSKTQAAGGGGGVVHKRGYGTASTDDGPSAGTGGRDAHTGRPERRTAQPLTRQEREGYLGFFR